MYSQKWLLTGEKNADLRCGEAFNRRCAKTNLRMWGAANHLFFSFSVNITQPFCRSEPVRSVSERLEDFAALHGDSGCGSPSGICSLASELGQCSRRACRPATRLKHLADTVVAICGEAAPALCPPWCGSGRRFSWRLRGIACRVSGDGFALASIGMTVAEAAPHPMRNSGSTTADFCMRRRSVAIFCLARGKRRASYPEAGACYDKPARLTLALEGLACFFLAALLRLNPRLRLAKPSKPAEPCRPVPTRLQYVPTGTSSKWEPFFPRDFSALYIWFPQFPHIYIYKGRTRVHFHSPLSRPKPRECIYALLGVRLCQDFGGNCGNRR